MQDSSVGSKRIRSGLLTAAVLSGLLAACSSSGSETASQTDSSTMTARAKVDVSKLGPQVGERVPDFSLPDQNGEIQTLQSIMGPEGAMLVFHRSADW